MRPDMKLMSGAGLSYCCVYMMSGRYETFISGRHENFMSPFHAGMKSHMYVCIICHSKNIYKLL